MTSRLHPVMARALSPWAPPEDPVDPNAAYGRCPKGHVFGRWDSYCVPCRLEEIRSHGVEPRSHVVLVDCPCTNRPEPPEEDCPFGCKGTGTLIDNGEMP